ncbi:MAG TPA: ATP synthase F0 subunit B [Terracidiphilus sp.]|nr:ATP synthase F0 subunit B [Terracidiphilus sp.]
MIPILHQAGLFLLAADAPGAQPEPGIPDQVGQLLVGALPTSFLFILVVLAYYFLVQKPLNRTLAERRARTEGAIEEAHKAIARAEERAQEYADQLRKARAEVYKIREQRIRQWSAEKDSALDAARKAAGQRVSQAKAELETEASIARKAIEASAGDLARQIVRAVLPVAAGGTR